MSFLTKSINTIRTLPFLVLALITLVAFYVISRILKSFSGANPSSWIMDLIHPGATNQPTLQKPTNGQNVIVSKAKDQPVAAASLGIKTKWETGFLSSNGLKDLVSTDYQYQFDESDYTSFVQNILFIMRANGYSEIEAAGALAQAYFETGNLKSSGFLDDHNAFGMKVVHTRWNTQLGPSLDPQRAALGFARYYTAGDCAIDYVCWLNFNSVDSGSANYKDYLSKLKQKGYFEETLDYYYNASVKYYNEIVKTTGLLA